MRVLLLLALLVCPVLTVQSQETASPNPPPADAAKAPASAAEPIGGVSVLPNRVVFEGKDRATEVMLKNSGAGRAVFRVSIVEKDMTEEGRLADREKKEGELTAADLIRFTPRQVELEPGESQIVRLQLRRPENLPDGEYRSHLLLQGIPPAQKAQPIEEGAEDSDRLLSFGITQVMGISIPVIVRQGSLSAGVELKLDSPAFYQPTYENSAPVISLWLQRTGNRSFLGDFKVTLESGGNKPKGTLLWEVKSVAIYTNLERRRVYLAVPAAFGGKLNGATARVTFTPRDIKLDPVSILVDLNL